jgi:hypothetical protein
MSFSLFKLLIKMIIKELMYITKKCKKQKIKIKILKNSLHLKGF